MTGPVKRAVALIAELRRRRVFRAAAMYLVAAWAVIEVTATVFPLLFISEDVVRAVTVLAVLGFPVVLVLAWAFDLTPEGLQRAPEPDLADDVPYRTRLALVVLTVLATALAGVGAWGLWLAPRVAAERAVSLDPWRVAVLYFDDHSESGELAHVADGFTEALIHELAQIAPLKVVSRYGVKPYRNPTVSFDSIARALNAGNLVEGSLERAGHRLVTTVQLIDGRSGAHTLSRRIERSGDDVLALRDATVREAARLLSRALGQELDVARTRSETRSAEAWALVERARSLVDHADTLRWKLGDVAGARRILAQADSLLERAEAHAPDWPAPTLMRAEVTGQRVRSGLQVGTEEEARLIRMGIERLDRILSRDPDHAAALALRGDLRYQLSWLPGDDDPDALLAAAEDDLRRAVARDPGSPAGWVALAELLRSRGDFAEASVAAERALEADPFLIHAEQSILFTLSHVWLELEDFQRAVRWNAEGRRRYPADPRFPAQQLAIMAGASGAERNADSAWALVRDVEDGYGFRGWTAGELQVAAVLIRNGRVDSARAVVTRARDRAGSDPWLDYYEANVRIQLGEDSRAIDLLERFIAAMPHRRSYIARDWWWRPLRDSARFQALVAEP
jgi:TolB-like protein